MQSISRAERRRSSRESAKRAPWGALEEFTRSRIQDWIKDLLEEEVAELLGRRRSERRAAADVPEGYRNGHGKPRRLSMMAGTIELRADVFVVVDYEQPCHDASLAAGNWTTKRLPQGSLPVTKIRPACATVARAADSAHLAGALCAVADARRGYARTQAARALANDC